MNYATLLNKAIQILAVREHSLFELQKKLEKYMGDQKNEELIEKVLIFCQEKKYIDNHRFTKILIESLKRKGKGPLYIQQKLQQAGIEKNLTNSDSEDSFDEIRVVAQKKLHTLTRYEKNDQKIRLMRFLMSRGFPFDLSKKVIDEVVIQD